MVMMYHRNDALSQCAAGLSPSDCPVSILHVLASSTIPCSLAITLTIAAGARYLFKRLNVLDVVPPEQTV